jgi:hypothetical protein
MRSRSVVTGVCLVLVAITWIVYGQTLRYGFVNYDDDAYVHDAPEIIAGVTLHGLKCAFTRTYVGNWQPLTSISHMLDCQFSGLNASGHHFTSVLLHTISVLLLFFLLRKMTGRPSRTDNVWPGAFVAALFAVHPLHVESVAWVAERKDVLSGVFFMLTLLAYVRYVRAPSLARYAAMSILFVCGLMSKPMLVTLPLVLLLLDYWPLQRQSSPVKLLVEKIPLLFFSAASAVTTVYAQAGIISSMRHLPMSWRIQNALVSIVIYIGQMLWPANLAVFYPHPHDQLPLWMVALSIALVAAITIAAVTLGRKRRYILVGWFWYLVMLVPVLGIVQVGLQGHADRYTYLPHLGLYLLITWGIVDLTARWRYRAQALSVAAVVAIGALTWCASVQASYWRDSRLLWEHTLAAAPNNDVAHTNLGNLLPGREAIPHYEKALQIAPHTALPLNNLAWIRATSPDPPQRDGAKALELAKEANQLSGGTDPVFVRTLAAAYAENGQFTEATDAALRALTLAIAQDNAALTDDLRRNIDNFQKHIPLRDQSLAP